MRAVVLGQSGQVATELQRQAARAGASLIVLGREAADLSKPQAALRVLDGLLGSVDVVINAAAYTAVDRAESEEAVAQAINAESPGLLARAAAARGVPFLHVSSDYVFDGSGTAAWQPDSPTNPLGAYGRSKLGGEIGVRQAGGAHFILRTSWVFSAHGANFVKTVLRLAGERDVLTIVNDQTGGPTPAADIAATLFAVARSMRDGQPGGTYHYAGAPDVTWAGFATEILSQAGIAVPVRGIPTTEYPMPARRPANSRLDCAALAADFGIARPDWRRGLAAVLADLGIAPAAPQ